MKDTVHWKDIFFNLQPRSSLARDRPTARATVAAVYKEILWTSRMVMNSGHDRLVDRIILKYSTEEISNSFTKSPILRFANYTLYSFQFPSFIGFRPGCRSDYSLMRF